MKTFHHKLGHEAGQTMTVAELRAKLAEYPDDMPVFGTWEGVSGFIGPDNFEVVRIHKGEEEDGCDCLSIDVEAH